MILSPISYYGAKAKVLPWLYEHFPRNGTYRTYVEPFIGSGRVLLSKERAAVEIAADIDPYVVNFMVCLRDNWRLLHALCQRDAGEAFFQYARRNLTKTADQFEAARMFFTLNAQGHKQLPRTPTWDDLQAAKRVRYGLRRFENYAATLLAHDRPGTFAYLDPPYPYIVRNRGTDEYRFDMGEIAEHLRLLRFIKALKHTKVMISSYAKSPDGTPNWLYERELRDWHSAEQATFSRIAVQSYRPARIEKIWMNYRHEV
jgi:site-specific DNA-adenine methylase